MEYSRKEPLPQYKKEFEELTQEGKDFVIKVQKKFRRYWWNPHCKTKCLGHKKVHKYSFEAYVEGFVAGYFGYDDPKEFEE